MRGRPGVGFALFGDQGLAAGEMGVDIGGCPEAFDHVDGGGQRDGAACEMLGADAEGEGLAVCADLCRKEIHARRADETCDELVARIFL